MGSLGSSVATDMASAEEWAFEVEGVGCQLIRIMAKRDNVV